MALPQFIKLPGHYVFDYKPMYYDARKEEREKKEKEVKRELGIEQEEEYKPDIKGRFKSKIAFSRHKQRTSNLTLILIAVSLGTMAYLFFYTDTLSMLTGIFVK